MAWSWSPSCSLLTPCLRSEDNDVLSCWVTWFISICKIFIRASIEESPGGCNILQIGRAVAQKTELICRKLLSWDKKTRNITQQFYLTACPPFSSVIGAQGVLPYTGKHDVPWKTSFSDNMFMCLSDIHRINALQPCTYIDIQWRRIQHLWQYVSVCHPPLHMLFPPVSMWLSNRRICETLFHGGDLMLEVGYQMKSALGLSFWSTGSHSTYQENYLKLPKSQSFPRKHWSITKLNTHLWCLGYPYHHPAPDRK